MKKVIISLTVAMLFGIGAAVYAYDSGSGGPYSCPAYNSGYTMMGPGYKGHMMGWRGGYDQKHLAKTVDARKELNSKQVAYFEAMRNPQTDPETIKMLKKDLSELRNKLHTRTSQGTNRGYGMPCWRL